MFNNLKYKGIEIYLFLAISFINFLNNYGLEINSKRQKIGVIKKDPIFTSRV